ncbi:bifunctional deaminase-reductase domain protein [Chondrocystis sp. NIES-4102]|nr:bifunctional deaminase-reductase domain protein [Chondrocystis sp. NIES-4102]
MNNRPQTTAILAMTADGKIADYMRSPARFGSINDKLHLETQVSLVDAVLFGADTLRAYQTTMSVSNPQLLQARATRLGISSTAQLQPVQIVVSASGNLDSQWRFFRQPIPRWLLTVPAVAPLWCDREEFERILTIQGTKNNPSLTDWVYTFEQLKQLGLNKLAILGGGELVASLLEQDLIDYFWLTICPVIFGGKTSPTPVGGMGLLQSQSQKLQLLEVKQLEQELFLHYQILKNN